MGVGSILRTIRNTLIVITLLRLATPEPLSLSDGVWCWQQTANTPVESLGLEQVLEQGAPCWESLPGSWKSVLPVDFLETYTPEYALELLKLPWTLWTQALYGCLILLHFAQGHAHPVESSQRWLLINKEVSAFSLVMLTFSWGMIVVYMPGSLLAQCCCRCKRRVERRCCCGGGKKKSGRASKSEADGGGDGRRGASPAPGAFRRRNAVQNDD